MRVLIITQYFEHCTLTPSQRITYWAKNFHRLGFYPIVITREWTEETNSHFDTKWPLDDGIRHEKFPDFEVFYLPFRPGILDRSYLKFGETSLRPLFRLIKLVDVFLAGLKLSLLPFDHLKSLPFLWLRKKLLIQRLFQASHFTYFG